MYNRTNISSLVGKTLTEVEGGIDSDVLMFHCSDGSVYKMYHEQDCCESVSINDIVGSSLKDLIGSPILVAYESSSSDRTADYESETWTFYNLSTMKDYVTIRWYGTSNGYYSEGVDFVQVA